jgi:hypothetical protein
MVAALMNLLSHLSMDEPITWQSVRITPLRLHGMADLEYLTLADSASETLITVEENSASGSVTELRVRNRAKSRVLIPEGSTLIGAKQNRVVNLSIMVAPESVTAIPVSCVERGRWRLLTPHFTAGCFADSPLRAKMCREATESLKKAGNVQVDQGEVWSHVDGMLQGAGACSPTAAYHALYEKWEPELADYEARLRLPKNASGVAVEIDGLLEAVDLFDKPNTLHTLWPRLLRSYVLAALRPGVRQGKATDAGGFLEHVLRSEGESFEPVGVGTTVRLTNQEAVGAALVCEGQFVHLSVFATEAAGQLRTAPPTLQAPSNQREGASERNERRRPWWKFWVYHRLG